MAEESIIVMEIFLAKQLNSSNLYVNYEIGII